MLAAFLESMFIVCFFLAFILPTLAYHALKKRRIRQSHRTHARQRRTVDFALRNGTFE